MSDSNIQLFSNLTEITWIRNICDCFELKHSFIEDATIFKRFKSQIASISGNIMFKSLTWAVFHHLLWQLYLSLTLEFQCKVYIKNEKIKYVLILHIYHLFYDHLTSFEIHCERYFNWNSRLCCSIKI